MATDNFDALREAISAPRLERYRPDSGSDLDMVVNYFWNIALSEALYPGLATLEIALRNSIHNALAFREQSETWFRSLLEPRQLRDYSNAYLTLHSRDQQAPKVGQVVAELSFGFWVSLLSQRYHQSIWAPNRAEMIHRVFPQLEPTPNARRYIHDRCNALRFLCNRVMHHEPILYGLVWNRAIRSTSALHNDILQAIGWISPILRDLTALNDRFPDVYERGRERIEDSLCHYFDS